MFHYTKCLLATETKTSHTLRGSSMAFYRVAAALHFWEY